MNSGNLMSNMHGGNEVRNPFYSPRFEDPTYKHNDVSDLPYDGNITTIQDDLSPMRDGAFTTTCRIHGSTNIHEGTFPPMDVPEKEDPFGAFRAGVNHNYQHCNPDVHRTCWCVNFIAEHTRLKEGSTKVKEDWKYVAMVLDRLFLWIFTLAVLVGTAGIILQAPSLYDDREALDKQYSEVYRAHRSSA
ncbi:UNVERIFIED_CONTAM: hypothetical protein RMT77_001809 [Armadillidium vulgare]